MSISTTVEQRDVMSVAAGASLGRPQRTVSGQCCGFRIFAAHCAMIKISD